MKFFSIVWAAAFIAINMTQVTASQVCQPQEFLFNTKSVVVRPIPDITYSKPDGSPFRLKSNKSQVTVYLPPEEIDRVSSFVKTKLECETSVGFVENKEIERGLIASFFPLASVDRRDTYFSLVADVNYALPYQPSNEHPLVVELNIKGR